ncbi:hypothetical protein TSUD_01220 [Trifolium subterraneum]|nr:hypothetical protein TSUD_01220 [Trifolium subterraneum]
MSPKPKQIPAAKNTLQLNFGSSLDGKDQKWIISDLLEGVKRLLERVKRKKESYGEGI